MVQYHAEQQEHGAVKDRMVVVRVDNVVYQMQRVVEQLVLHEQDQLLLRTDSLLVLQHGHQRMPDNQLLQQ